MKRVRFLDGNELRVNNRFLLNVAYRRESHTATAWAVCPCCSRPYLLSFFDLCPSEIIEREKSEAGSPTSKRPPAQLCHSVLRLVYKSFSMRNSAPELQTYVCKCVFSIFMVASSLSCLRTHTACHGHSSTLSSNRATDQS